MRNVPYQQALSPVRTVAGRITFRDKRLRFAEQPAESLPGIPLQADSDLSDHRLPLQGSAGTQIYRAAIIEGRIYESRWDTGVPDSWPSAWAETPYSVNLNSRLGVTQDFIFYQSPGGGTLGRFGFEASSSSFV
jgi:hypothetical protein